MIEEKGLDADVADKIGVMVNQSGHGELADKLMQQDNVKGNTSAMQGLNEMKLFLHYCDIYQVSSRVVFDMSLARGLDYYTGIIYEAILTSQVGGDEVSVGSIAGGGRYDNLVGIFHSKGQSVPCVGLSIGIERIFSILETKLANTKIKTVDTEVYVTSAQKNLMEERMHLCRELWDAGIRASHPYKKNPKMLSQLQYCEENDIPYAIIIGQSELEKGVVKLRVVATREETEVSRADMLQVLKDKLNTS